MVIAIGGASRSGKSLFAQSLFDACKNLNPVLIKQDNYSRQIDQLPLYDNGPDWEHPDGLNFDEMISALKKATEYYKLVIVEGFLIYANPQLDSLFDYRVFVDIDYETFFERKKMDIRWGQVTDDYIQHIWKSFKKYGQAPKNIDFFIDGKDAGKWTDDIKNIKYQNKLN